MMIRPRVFVPKIETMYSKIATKYEANLCYRGYLLRNCCNELIPRLKVAKHTF
jgi:hypothetical protein